MWPIPGQGNLNLITQALEAVGCEMQVIPDPSTVHFHLPNNLSVQVHREYNDFIKEMISTFPHEKDGIIKFYSECWKVCSLALQLQSLGHNHFALFKFSTRLYAILARYLIH